MQSENWRPSASIDALKKRALVLQTIRQFFAERKVLEVDTPALSHATVTDQHLYSFSTQFNNPMAPSASTLYLQTSPEFAMKRLLSSGSGPIYQICKSFRNEESGRFHNPEFTMLEWYRPEFDHLALMVEINQLIQSILACEPAQTITYQQAFLEYLDCDPLSADVQQLKQLASQYGYAEVAKNETDKDTLLTLLFNQHVEPKIGQTRPCFVTNFPASQAALAQIDPSDSRVAQRFELYFKGMELANGFHELTDAEEQLKRFEQNNVKRQRSGLPTMPIDQNLIAALESGLPQCAGVAMGIDRLLMLVLNSSHINQVLAFDTNRA